GLALRKPHDSATACASNSSGKQRQCGDPCSTFSHRTPPLCDTNIRLPRILPISGHFVAARALIGQYQTPNGFGFSWSILYSLIARAASLAVIFPSLARAS